MSVNRFPNSEKREKKSFLNREAQLLAEKTQILNIISDNNALIQTILYKNEAGVSDEIDVSNILPTINQLAHLIHLLHPADLADLLEGLPGESRQAIWQLADNKKRGKTLLEVSAALWESLLAVMEDDELLMVIKSLHIDDQVYLAEYLPRNLMGRLLTTLEPAQRARVRSVIQYERDSVGRLMDFQFVTVRDDISLKVVQRYLRYRKIIPESTDKIFVVRRDNTLIGELALTTILLHAPKVLVGSVMTCELVTFSPEQEAEEAASAFERYDLITAAVIDAQGKLMGRITVDEVINIVNEESSTSIRRMSGLSVEEDIFSSALRGVKARSPWLAINLVTAFLSSRVVSLFQDTIEQLTVLAALMPIITGIGGNTGNQTITMIVRALALHQVQLNNCPFLLQRELKIASVNGLLWGGIMGVVTYLLYDNLALATVMTSAMVLNLVLAAFMGVTIPMLQQKLGTDPATGSSVLITAITDSGGFFIFLGLAYLFL